VLLDPHRVFRVVLVLDGREAFVASRERSEGEVGQSGVGLGREDWSTRWVGEPDLVCPESEEGEGQAEGER
jgi:hypothetical protein